MIRNLLLASVAATVAFAQRPSNTSICDYYTTALLSDNTAAHQKLLLTLVVNTALVGNYTKPNVGISVPGILAQNQTYNGVPTTLLQFFDGTLLSNNRGGDVGVAVSFLDGGGAAPLMMNMPANSTSTNQYKLLTHLYSYFGILLGCSQLGQPGYPPYGGFTGLYDVHRFMDLDANQVGYFIQQVGLSAASFGVTDADVESVGTALQTLFGHRCAKAVDIVPGAKAELQAICIDNDCPLAPDATCAAYSPAFKAAVAMPTSTSSMLMYASISMPMYTSISMPTATGAASNRTLTNTTVTMGAPSPTTAPAVSSAPASGGVEAHAKVLMGMVVLCSVAATLWVG